MALAKDLPIYKVCYDLLSVAADCTQHMPRLFKRAIGDRLILLSTDLVMLVYQANCVAHKAPVLTTLLEQLQVTQLLYRLCFDKRFISRQLYAQSAELTTSIGKQATAWRKSSGMSPAT